jgi:sodium/proline symporter
MVIVTAVTLAYTLFGGFLGASLTDVVQGLMMVTALVIVPIVAIANIGGFSETASIVETVGSGNLSIFGGAELGAGATALIVISGLAWGLGYFGQPHIIVRFMALRSTRDAASARRIGTSWQFVSLLGAVSAGLIGIAYFDKFGGAPQNPETVVLLLSQTLLHPLVSGLVLASVLAAIMSTLSSQLIVCSSALVEDIYRAVKKTPPSQQTLVVLGRVGVLLIAVIAALLAITPNDTILGLVAFAGAGFGAAFGPIVLLSLYWRRLTNWGALAGMVSGAIGVFVWPLFETGLYELLPAFVLALLVAVGVSLATYRRNEEIEQEFTDTGVMIAVGKQR